MAEIIARIDTETDIITVTVNDVEVPNVTDVDMHCYLNYDNEPTSCVSIGTTFRDNNGLVERTYISKAGVSTTPPGLKMSKASAKAIQDVGKLFK